ncbi:hypothetical protein Ae201684P_012729 [Aphanomyces euteiches]|nr:hypothetical protein Ae201684P_012729 [Aphanomyces euteiches]
MKKYFRGEFDNLSQRECQQIAKTVHQFDICEEGALYRLLWSTKRSPTPQLTWSLVIPRSLVTEVLQQCHDGVQGGHFKFMKTYAKAKAFYYWDSMYADTKTYCENCETCATGAPSPHVKAPSPGNLLRQRPMDIVCFDIGTDLPKSFRGNTQLVLFEDIFTAMVMVKATPNRHAHTIAQAYEEAVFRRFGACRELRHDREPSFMSEVFKHFAAMLGQSQSPTFAYRPQANGTADRGIQTITRMVKLYIQDPHQRDWDDVAERMVFALNTSVSATRKETPFFLMHGWDPYTTMMASLPSVKTDANLDSYEWRQQLYHQHAHCMDMARLLVKQAVEERARQHNEGLPADVDTRIRVGDAVWVYIDKVKPGVKLKLAHLWHGPFRVVNRLKNYASEVEVVSLRSGKNHRFYTTIHDSRLKTRRLSPLRPTQLLEGIPPVDFDEELLPDTSFTNRQQSIPGTPLQVPVAVRNTRLNGGIRELEVQLINDGPWTWEPEALLESTPELRKFHRDRLGWSRLAMMVDDDLNPPPTAPEGPPQEAATTV